MSSQVSWPMARSPSGATPPFSTGALAFLYFIARRTFGGRSSPNASVTVKRAGSFTRSEVTPDEAGIGSLVAELVADHTIG